MCVQPRSTASSSSHRYAAISALSLGWKQAHFWSLTTAAVGINVLTFLLFFPKCLDSPAQLVLQAPPHSTLVVLLPQASCLSLKESLNCLYWKRPKDHVVPTPLLWAGKLPPDRVARSAIQPDLKHFQGLGHPQLPWASLFQGLTTLIVKNFFLMSNQNLLSLSLKAFSFVLPHCPCKMRISCFLLPCPLYVLESLQAVQRCCSETLLQERAAGDSSADSTMRQGSHWPPPPAPCRWWDLSSVQLSSPHTSRAHSHQELLPLTGMEDAGHRPFRWPSHSQRFLCCWWSPGEAVLLCTFGEGIWALAQTRRRWRCLKEAFCGEVRHFCFLCPPGAAWCAWPPP